MVERSHKHEWRVIGASSRGVAHVRAGQPNQDAWGYWVPNGVAGPPVIVAVSDGHGSAVHFRSEVGARVAVHAATQVLRAFAEEWAGAVDWIALEEAAVRALPRRLVELWTEDIASHLAATPFSAAEWAQVPEQVSSAMREAVEGGPLLAYGATVLAVLVAESFVIYLQLGDGDILCVDDHGETTRPLPPDPRLVANETTSLCGHEAWEEFRVRVVRTDMNRPPALVLVSTDGYANSFQTEQDFLMIGRDYLRLVHEQGLERVQVQLESILEDASAHGSGDDVTLGLLRRTNGGKERVRTIKDESQISKPSFSVSMRYTMAVIGALYSSG